MLLLFIAIVQPPGAQGACQALPVFFSSHSFLSAQAQLHIWLQAQVVLESQGAKRGLWKCFLMRCAPQPACANFRIPCNSQGDSWSYRNQQYVE
jgi:hypothetical protein